MGFFRYKKSGLYCEGAALEELAQRYKTPLYVYSRRCLEDSFLRLKKAFAYPHTLICYSVKANSNINILKVLLRAGAGLDIVSGGELYRAGIAGCRGKKIVYASVGKTASEISAALDRNILLFNVESEPELKLISAIAGQKGKRADVALRVNPDVGPRTHKYTVTGKKETKFGIDIFQAEQIISSRRRHYPYINICALHVHIGSQIMEAGPFWEAAEKVAGLIDRINKKERIIHYLDIGGGFGIDYQGRKRFPLKKLAAGIIKIAAARRLRLILEPGRYIAGPAGVLLTKVIYIKNTPSRRFIIVDAAMNDLIRPALYGACHRLLPLKRRACGGVPVSDVVGPVCESGDFIAKQVRLNVKEGDYLAVMDAGAYGFSMASNYNSRLRPAEVLVNGQKAKLIRKRETWEDLVAKEI